MHIGEAEVAALTAEGEAFMVDSQLVKNSSMEVVDVNFVLGGVIAKVIGRTVGEARFHSTAGHPHRKAVRVMVTPPGFTHHLRHRCPAEFTAPDDESIIE